MTSDTSLSLAKNLREVFRKLAGTRAPEDSGFGAWALALGGYQVASTLFIDRLSIVTRGCHTLIMTVQNAPATTLSTESKQVYINSIKRLQALTNVQMLHRKWSDDLSKQLKESDIHNLTTLSDRLAGTPDQSTISGAEIDDLIASMESLHRQISEATIDDAVRNFLREEIANLLDFLRHIDIYGFDGVWQANARVQAAFLRYQDYLRNRHPSIWNTASDVTGTVVERLVKYGAFFAGADAVYQTGNLLTHTVLPALIKPAM